MTNLLLPAAILALLAGPLAELRWETYLELVMEQLGPVEPAPPVGHAVRIEYRSIGPAERSVAAGEFAVGSIRPAFRLERRPGMASRGRAGSVSLAGSARSGRTVLGVGPVRGGLGSGLLIWTGRWGGRSGFSSAWSGLPPALRAAPVTPSTDPYRGLVLDIGRYRPITLTVLRRHDRSWITAAAWSWRAGASAVIAVWSRGGGLEATVGSPNARLAWRLTGAAWEGVGGRWRGVAELRLSGGATAARWSARLWHGSGRSPAASWVWGGSRIYRWGHAMGIRMRPGPGTALEGAIERAYGDAGAGPRSRWSEQLLLTTRISPLGAIRLRLRQRGEDVSTPWTGRSESRQQSISLSLSSPSSTVMRWFVESKFARDVARGRSFGVRCEWRIVGRSWQAWTGITRSLVSAGVPLYWFDSAPAGSWGMRSAWVSETRVAIGISARPEGWHVQLVVGPGRQVGVVAGWRVRLSAGG